MAKIKNICLVKSKLQLGEIKAATVWSYDGQEKLKGNSVKAFEKDLKRICDFEILQKGREKVYVIKELFEITLEREQHGNKRALKGNKNKEGCYGFNDESINKFIASTIINKIEYFEKKGGNGYKTVGQFMIAFGLYSEKYDQVNNTIRSSFIYVLNKMKKLEYLKVNTTYFKVIYGKRICISQEEYDNIKNVEKAKFKELVSETDFKKYKCAYNYSAYSKSFLKDNILLEIRNDTGVDYVYKMYLIETVKNISLSVDEKYKEIVYTVYEYKEDNCNEENTQENIKSFVNYLEEKYELKLEEFKIKRFLNSKMTFEPIEEGFTL